MLSNNLLKCIKGENRFQLQYDQDGYFSIPLYFHGVQGYYVFFDPWSGKEVDQTFSIYAENAEVSRDNWEQEIREEVKKHKYPVVCSELSWFLKGGDEEGMTSIIHVPNIRTYAILNKKEYGGFEEMDFCPFCGAKLPERLDGKLTEILQTEYGLQSWRDYKKAPHEFHTDEWWKKRGL